MSADEFVKQYDANEMAAPLDTIFQFRENELADIESAILKENVSIIYGKVGTGKTRIVLEAVKRVVQKQGYHLLCVKNNNLGLYDDLIACTETPGKYLFSLPYEKQNIASGDENGDENIVLCLIKQYPDITAKKMSEQTGFSTRKISRIIKGLRETEKIIRVGSDRKGYWKISG